MPEERPCEDFGPPPRRSQRESPRVPPPPKLSSPPTRSIVWSRCWSGSSELHSIRSNPADATLTLTYAVARRLDLQARPRVRRDRQRTRARLPRTGGEQIGRIAVACERDADVTFLHVTRDLATFSPEELGPPGRSLRRALRRRAGHESASRRERSTTSSGAMRSRSSWRSTRCAIPASGNGWSACARRSASSSISFIPESERKSGPDPKADHHDPRHRGRGRRTWARDLGEAPPAGPRTAPRRPRDRQRRERRRRLRSHRSRRPTSCSRPGSTS